MYKEENVMKSIGYSELLNLLEKQGIIIDDDVQKIMIEEERKKILKSHPYDIFTGSDGRLKTYVPDKTKKSGRRLIAKSTLEKLEDAIIEDYNKRENSKNAITDEHKNADEKDNLNNNITLRKIYPEWLDYKSTQTDSTSYIQRIHCDWKKFYEGTELIDKPIKELTYLYLNKWAYNLIKNNNLTKKSYYNITVIIRQCLDFASEPEIGMIDTNPFERVKFNSKMFQKEKQPKSETQVFLNRERQRLIARAYEKFLKRPRYTTPLIIILNFFLGLRLGELSSLKKSDIEGRYIKIQRSSIKDYEVICSDKVEIIPKENRVVDHTKSSAGERSLYLVDEAVKILKLLEETNKKYGYYDEDFLFISCYNQRTSPSTIATYLWTLCHEVGIEVPKGNHKIRKTFISALFDANLNINTIREMAGHESEQTSLRNYCFDRSERTEMEQKLENLSSTIMVS